QFSVRLDTLMAGLFHSWSRPALMVLAAALWVSSLAHAQPAAPRPPDKYKAIIRYRIIAPRDPHVALYDELIAHLKGLHFEFIPALPPPGARNTDREDQTKDRLTGLVPSGKAFDILQNPSVASVMLIPEKFAVPDDLRKPVRVRIELASSLSDDRQRELWEQ